MVYGYLIVVNLEPMKQTKMPVKKIMGGIMRKVMMVFDTVEVGMCIIATAGSLTILWGTSVLLWCFHGDRMLISWRKGGIPY